MGANASSIDVKDGRDTLNFECLTGIQYFTTRFY